MAWKVILAATFGIGMTVPGHCQTSDPEANAGIARASSARALLDLCTLEGLTGGLVCNSYFAGFRQASAAYEQLGNQRPLYCYKWDRAGFKPFIVGYLQAHPELLDLQMGPVVLHALREKYPCKAD